MAEYKKKKSKNRIKISKPKNKKAYNYESIEFSPKEKTKTKQKKSRSSNRRYRASNPLKVLITITLAITLISSFLIIHLLHPAGVIEYFSYLYSSAGSNGGYDIDINGGRPLNSINYGDKYILVTDTSVNCYNSSGNTIFENTHVYSKPIVKVGDTRYILYGQGEKELSVCTLSKTLYKTTFDKNIICAAISKSGGYAVATKADGYDSSVSVYNAKNKKVFEWFSTNETINAVALSDNGKQLAVSTLKTEVGKFVSNVYVFKFDSASPIATKNYVNKIIYRLSAVSSANFMIEYDNGIDFLNFKNNTVKTYQSAYDLSIVKRFGNNIIAVRTVAANQDESIIEVYKTSGKLTNSFSVSSFVTDFSYHSGKIYLLGNSNISKYNLKGELISSVDTTYDALFLEYISSDKVASIGNSLISKRELSEVGD